MHFPSKSPIASTFFVAMLAGCGDDATTTPPPAGPQGSNGITVITPNGGESFRVGGQLPISWTYSNDDFTSANITIGCGTTEWYGLTSTSISPLVIDTSFAIPDSVYSPSQRKLIAFPTGSGCKVKIADYTITSILDTSDAPFTVLPK